MELTFFLKDKKTPLLPPRLAHVVGQFTDTQAGDGISTGGDESHIHDAVCITRVALLDPLLPYRSRSRRMTMGKALAAPTK
jgi:hypothetical protein